MAQKQRKYNYCRMLKVTKQGFYKYLANKGRPWKYQDLANAILAIVLEDECNAAYGRVHMYQARKSEFRVQ